MTRWLLAKDRQGCNNAVENALRVSRSGSTCECGGRTTGGIGVIPEVHGGDKAAIHSEYVENFAVRKNIPVKVLDELVHPDSDLTSVFLRDCQWFDTAIELAHCRVQ